MIKYTSCLQQLVYHQYLGQQKLSKQDIKQINIIHVTHRFTFLSFLDVYSACAGAPPLGVVLNRFTLSPVVKSNTDWFVHCLLEKCYLQGYKTFESENQSVINSKWIPPAKKRHVLDAEIHPIMQVFGQH